jgi:hypothetical protein
MPKEYLERDIFESDFKNFLQSADNVSLVICSRTSDGLDDLHLPVYYLDEIDGEDIAAELKRLKVHLVGPFQREMYILLRKPFYFHYIATGQVVLAENTHPRDFYIAFFNYIQREFRRRFDFQLDIIEMLSSVAYYALEIGEEAFPQSTFIDIAKKDGKNKNLSDITIQNIVNWLISISILAPFTKGRIAFIHQSITEYLAAIELAKEYRKTPEILWHKLCLNRWDQAIFLTISILPSNLNESFLQDVIKADFSFALNAVKYMEDGQEETVSKLLSIVASRVTELKNLDSRIESAIEHSLPLNITHEPQLRSIMKCGNMIGAAAAKRLAEIKGNQIKDEFLELLIECRSDYNFCCNGIAPAISQFIDESDVKKIAIYADDIQKSIITYNEEELHGFIYGSAAILEGIEISTLQREFLHNSELGRITQIKIEIICNAIRSRHSTEALEFAGELLLAGYPKASITIYFIAEYIKPNCKLSWLSFSVSHVSILVNSLYSEIDNWEIKVLRKICLARIDLCEIVKIRAQKKSGIIKAALLSCIPQFSSTDIFSAIEELLTMTDDELHNLPYGILGKMCLDWSGYEKLFVNLLKLRDPQIATMLLKETVQSFVKRVGIISIGSIDWWLDWVLELSEDTSTDNRFWLVYWFAKLFSLHLSESEQEKFVIEFNKPDSKYKYLLLKRILPYMNVSIDMLNKDTISYILEDLRKVSIVGLFDGHLIANIATETFVSEHLLPLLPNATSPLSENLKLILSIVGQRHGRRYVFESFPELEEIINSKKSLGESRMVTNS